MSWTKEDLQELVKTKLADRLIHSRVQQRALHS